MKKRLLAVLILLALASANVYSNMANDVFIGNLHLGRDSQLSELMLYDEKSQETSANSNDNKKLYAALDDNKELITKALTLFGEQALSVTKIPPYQLRLVNIKNEAQKATIIDHNIDPNIKRFERSHWYLYIKTNDDGKYLKAYNAQTKQSIAIAKTFDDFVTFTVTHTGYILASNPQQIYYAQLMLRGDRIQMNDNWKPIKMPKSPCTQSIQNIAVSHFANRLAILCD